MDEVFQGDPFLAILIDSPRDGSRWRFPGTAFQLERDANVVSVLVRLSDVYNDSVKSTKLTIRPVNHVDFTITSHASALTSYSLYNHALMHLTLWHRQRPILDFISII